MEAIALKREQNIREIEEARAARIQAIKEEKLQKAKERVRHCTASLLAIRLLRSHSGALRQMQEAKQAAMQTKEAQEEKYLARKAEIGAHLFGRRTRLEMLARDALQGGHAAT